MESSSSAKERYNPPKYNKRVFSGRSSSEEVVEISPPSANQTWKLKANTLKQKEVAAYHEIIDVDMDDEDRKDVLVFIEGGEVQSNKMTKGAMGIFVGPSNAQQGSMHRGGQTTKKVESNNKGKGVSMMGGVQMDSGHYSKSFVAEKFIDLDDDYGLEDDYSMALQLQSLFDNMDRHLPPPTATAANNNSSKNHPVVGVDTSFSTMYPVVAAGNNNPRKVSSLTGSCSSMGKVVKIEDDDVLEKYESFNKFDIVVDFSDHYYATQSSGMMQPPKNWSKKIQDEWRMLEEHLPETICVRAYESRMDLLRAVIIGAQGTPYHDGLFFFDVCFTSTYPDTPPLVHYHSGGLDINPNLHKNGKVCLSLLNTWVGTGTERWVPGTSTMLQILVSIQGLVLNTKPAFNYHFPKKRKRSSIVLEQSSILYNQCVLILSLKTMVYTITNPPKNFEDFVSGHFRRRVRYILMACKAYIEGVQVGCVVRGGVHDLDEGNNKYSCSDGFKCDVVACVKKLVAAFKSIGANEEADEFIWLSEKKIPSCTCFSRCYQTTR